MIDKETFFHPTFIKTATRSEEYPIIRDLHGNLLPEIAVVGRSNVGKSTLINHLFQHKGIARTSSQPGKTQALNFFKVGNALSFVDLPGYGYAAVPSSVRRSWGPMVQEYLKTRETLKLILFLLDIRRDPKEEELQLLHWISAAEKAMILVLTKVDKLNQSERIKRTQAVLEALPADNLYHVLYSAPKNVGRPQLIKLICEALADEEVN